MEILTQNNSLANQRQAAQSPSTADGDALSSDFETFLLMLTTQMQNQDPLNPIESQDFAVQLATFSGVEQQVRTNELLESLSGGMGRSGLAELASWIGKEARVSAPVEFDGSPVTISVKPEPGASSTVLTVLDGSNRVVAREPVPAGIDTLEWAGVGADGRPLQAGSYTLQLDSYSGEELVATSEVSHYTTITEARLGGEGPEVVLAGGSVVPTSAITALRLPDDS